MNHLLEQYQSVRTRTQQLCKPLSAEDCVVQSTDFASPPKWHLAHTTWFFEEMILSKYLTDYQIFDPQFSFLFNSYYNTVGAQLSRSDRGLITRPALSQVYEYRRYVDEHITQLLATKNTDAEELIVIGIQHEQQHQELLITDLNYTFSQNPTYPKYSDENWVDNDNQNTGWQAIDGGVYEIGHAGEGFCFDNELGHHKVLLESFQIAKNLVSNAAYIQFIEEGGYANVSFWLDEGWSWIQQNNISAPLYWHQKDGEWYHYTLSGYQLVDVAATLCHISFYEAAAFANYRDCRLPTEFEWEAAATDLDWGSRWEWTYSAYLPYPRFEIQKGAVGEYNGKFMMNQMVLRGASTATAEGHSRKTYRNFFQPHTQWQFSGIRLAR